MDSRRVVLGITGGIAAVKSVLLVRALRDAGAEVRVVLSRGAEALVSPLSLQALSGHPVHRHLFDERQEAAMGHIELARWAELVLVAPATANCIARLANGLADDLLTTLCLVTRAPVALAPAMNSAMWDHPATRANCARLAERGVRLWGPGRGGLACGEEGEGRMEEPEQLVARVRALLAPGRLAGVRALVTAGPTREPIDPVRFVGNRSSGKMGFAVAAALRDQGAQVVLVSGPVGLADPPGVEVVRVERALEMERAVQERVGACDLFVGVAAVADYRPERVADAKIKKKQAELTLRLVRNPDILAQVAARTPRPFTVGFAAETERVEAHAREKLRAKRLDLVAANRVGGEAGGFECDDNSLVALWEGGRRELPSGPKARLAAELVALIAERMDAAD